MLKTYNKTEDRKDISRDLIRGKAFYFLGRREHSQIELQKKLRERFPEKDVEIQAVIQEFVTKDWISDIRYTEELVREKSQYGGWGPIKITQRLREKGIEKELIESVLEKLFPEELQKEVVMRLATEKWRLLYKKTAPQRKAAVQRFLVSRGFSFSTVFSCMELFTQEDLLEDPLQVHDSKIQ